MPQPHWLSGSVSEDELQLRHPAARQHHLGDGGVPGLEEELAQPGREDKIRAMDAGTWGRQGGGFYAFDYGHMLLWTQWSNPQDRPNYPRQAEYTEKFGEGTARWMIGQLMTTRVASSTTSPLSSASCS